MEWQEGFGIGVLEIDIQHKLLFGKVNDFLAACQRGAEIDEILRLFWFLEAYAVTHFKDEERLMEDRGYPELAAHRRRHQEFAVEVGRLKEQLRNEGATPALVSSIAGFVSSWLVEHITRMDRAIGSYLNP